jgi:purine-binding chemotaxis protein CheW
MTKVPASNRADFDWEDAKHRLSRLAHTLDESGSTHPDETNEALDNRARELAKPLRNEVAEPDTIEALTFGIGPDTYALETEFILEITNLTTLTIVPGCPAFLRGITNLRGEILAVIDLSLFFGLGPASGGNRLLVLGHERPEYGIVIDEADEVKVLSRSSIVLPAVAIPETQREFLLGVTPNATLVLDGNALLSDTRFMIDEA